MLCNVLNNHLKMKISFTHFPRCKTLINLNLNKFGFLAIPRGFDYVGIAVILLRNAN